MSYFPSRVTVRVGDTVRWLQNSNEIHTVTFLGGQAAPALLVSAASLGLPSTPSPLVFNPMAVDRATTGGLGDTTTLVNSGLMGREQGQYRSFRLKFTATGTYDYECLVHGQIMSGEVSVLAAHAKVPTPGAEKALGRHQIKLKLAEAPAVIRAARRHIKPAVTNPDGTKTFFVNLGYSKGQIDLMWFFPKTLTVLPGDSIVWRMTKFSDAPHTVTFLNGTAEPALVIPVAQMSGPPVLYVNPAVLDPNLPAPDLMRTGYYNSGLLNPVPGTTYTLTVGKITSGLLRYRCLLHDASGMKGRLVVQTK
jgi:plastocyanin